MKRIFLWCVACAILVLTAISFQSCVEEKYKVWTDSCTYTEFRSMLDYDLEDGYYVRVALNNEQWETLSKDLTKEYLHRWDEATIKKWLMSVGFGDAEASQEAAWLVLNNHGMIFVRDRGFVYFICK